MLPRKKEKDKKRAGAGRKEEDNMKDRGKVTKEESREGRAFYVQL